MNVTATTTPPASRTARSRRESLDTLARKDAITLGSLYAAAPEPSSLSPLEGNPTGRMLAVKRLDHGVVADRLRDIAASRSFPWGGKTFRGQGAEGTGVNRVHLLGRHQVFPFLTFIGPSALDGRRAIVLDYDLPDNPSLIRAIHDEVREVDEGLYLGPAMWKGAHGKELVLWFALDTKLQAEPVGRKAGRA